MLLGSSPTKMQQDNDASSVSTETTVVLGWFSELGFEEAEAGHSKMLGLRVTSAHKRSESSTDKRRVDEDGLKGSLETSHDTKLDMELLKGCVKTDKKQSHCTQVHSSLKQEILQLETRLEAQFEVRHALEKAMGYRSSTAANDTNESSIAKPATELVREIAVLELEVVYLEQYLLSLYRQTFDEKSSSKSPPVKDLQIKSPFETSRGMICKASQLDGTSKSKNLTSGVNYQSLDSPRKEPSCVEEEKRPDSGIRFCHSSLSQRSAFSTRTSPKDETTAKAISACHSQPLSMMEYGENTSTSLISLAEHFGTRISDHVPDTPNRLAEDMVKCMSAVYCKLADPVRTNQGFSSPNSSFSSVSGFSPREQCDTWSPGFRNNSSFCMRLDNPFHEFSGPYSTMFEVQWLYRDNQKLGDIEHLLQDFRSLVSQLEEVNPSKLNREEKLAFWINVHNALVMHAFLAYGIPQNSVKRVFLLLKAAYNIGGITISVDTMQSAILGCRVSRPGQWLRLLLSSKMKFKSEDERQAYAIEHPEPLLHFALCSGSHSDPAVRVYTPKRIFEELEAAKEDYIRATFGLGNDNKILLPKTMESFAKDSGMCEAGLLEMIQESLPESLRKSVVKRQPGKSKKSISWIPHNFTFRFLISKEIVK